MLQLNRETTYVQIRRTKLRTVAETDSGSMNLMFIELTTDWFVIARKVSVNFDEHQQN